MNIEQQGQLNFLDEAEDCYERIERTLLGLSTHVAEAGPLDEALRAAHSVKGGAAMMGLADLSKVAHRLEDFFKILRVHHVSKPIDAEVGTLLLQGLDALRQVGDRYRQGEPIDHQWLAHQIHPVFDQLQTHLGDLTDEDENALLSQDEGIADPALLMFEDGVATILERLEAHGDTLSGSQLAQELATTAEELSAFGHMANLDAFIQLCHSIQQLAQQISPDQTAELCQAALRSWQRSHALVLRRRFEKLPSQLEGFSLISADPFDTGLPELAEDLDAFADVVASVDLTALQADFATPISPIAADLDDLALTDSLAAEGTVEAFSEVPDPDLFAAVGEIDAQMLADLQDAFAVEVEVEAEATPDQPLTLESAAEVFRNATVAQSPTSPVNPQISGKTVRVPVEQLEQFNTLFGKLILERNTINLRLNQLQTYTALMRQRIYQLEQSNTQLQQWYDRASLEGMVSTEGIVSPVASLISSAPAALEHAAEGFDALEMDRYTDLHLIAQGQIETIVQLQEVSSDIDLTVQDMDQSVRGLNQTTRSLKGNVTRTQMVPFAEAVKRFPRLIRDLSVQFNKPVQLQIEGDNTLIDRAALEALADALNHLLRNAFDHGIGSPEHRASLGKPLEGTITIKARNRGAQTVISVSDDGAGIRLDKVRDRLLKMGLTQTEIEHLSEADLLDWIFEPGFSTSAQVTELSGRGMGMDIVRTNLRDLRGDIQVQTQPHVGTTFTLTVPYTLSILRVMVLEHSSLLFAVPVDSIRELLRLDPEHLQNLEGTPQFTWQNQKIPIVRLGQHWIFNQTQKFSEMLGVPIISQPTVLVVGEEDKLGGLEIERFWGEQEVTIRTIESPLPLPPGFVSSTVLGDGRVVPIVDPIALMQWCLEGERAGMAAPNPAIVDPLDSQPQESNTILVVDDSVNVRRLMANTLEKAGYRVEQAKDGQDAVDQLFGGLSVQAVVCDIEMPRLDGYGVLEEVKGRPEFQDLPIAMLTSRSNEKHRKLAINLGASAYFSKPYNEQQFLQKLAELVSRYRAVSRPTLDLVH